MFWAFIQNKAEVPSSRSAGWASAWSRIATSAATSAGGETAATAGAGGTPSDYQAQVIVNEF